MPASCAYPGSYGALSVQALTVRTQIPGPAVEQLRGHGWPVKGVIPGKSKVRILRLITEELKCETPSLLVSRVARALGPVAPVVVLEIDEQPIAAGAPPGHEAVTGDCDLASADTWVDARETEP